MATLIAVYGLFMTPLVWGYALVWFLVNDRVKLLAYRIFDPTQAQLLAKATADLTPQTVRRAYELYKQHGPSNRHETQDWLQAENEIWKDDSLK